MAGEPDVVEKLKKGYQAIGRTYKNHIDGFNLLPYLTGKEKESPRKLFIYISDDGDILGVRYDNWKVVFMEQRCKGTMQVWAEPFTRLRLPKLFNLRTDPYEFADVTSNTLLRVVPLPRLHPLRRAWRSRTSSRRRSRTSRRSRSRTPSPSTTRCAKMMRRRQRHWQRAGGDIAADRFRRWANRWPRRSRPGTTARRSRAILDFVARVTKEGGPDFVPPAERIATFDNDGTLWCEQPMQVQVFFAHRPR